jgi:hypothetical protein
MWFTGVVATFKSLLVSPTNGFVRVFFEIYLPFLRFFRPIPLILKLYQI